MNADLMAELAEVVRKMRAFENMDGTANQLDAAVGEASHAAYMFINRHHAELEAMARAKDVLAWFAGRDTGMSSEAIALHMSGVTPDDPVTPSDPSDLGRCLRLLERFPEWKLRMGEMAKYSNRWAQLVPKWNELAQMMADEVGIDWSKGKSAPRTYAAMQSERPE